MQFYTQYDRPPRTEEINNGPILVETAGYLTAKQQIENILRAGEQLIAYRKEMYDFGSGEPVPDDAEDPTRAPNYDMADASIMMQETEERMRAKTEEPSNEEPPEEPEEETPENTEE